MKNISRSAAAQKLRECGFIVEPTPCYFNGIYVGVGFSYSLHNGAIDNVPGIKPYFIDTIRPDRFKTREILNKIAPKIARMFGIEDTNKVWEELEMWRKSGPVLFLEKLEQFVINPLFSLSYEHCKNVIESHTTQLAALTTLLNNSRMLRDGWSTSEDESFLYLDFSKRRYRAKKSDFAFFLQNGFLNTERGFYVHAVKSWEYYEWGAFSRNHFLYNNLNF